MYLGVRNNCPPQGVTEFEFGAILRGGILDHKEVKKSQITLPHGLSICTCIFGILRVHKLYGWMHFAGTKPSSFPSLGAAPTPSTDAERVADPKWDITQKWSFSFVSLQIRAKHAKGQFPGVVALYNSSWLLTYFDFYY